jgi:hypothetical protein
MNRNARRLAALLSPLVVLAACSSGPQHTTRLLDQRLQAQLAPDIAAGKAALQPLPNGARITLLGNPPFPDNRKARETSQGDVRASVIESLLDPTLMRVTVADTSGLPQSQRDTRVRSLEQYFTDYGLASTLQPGVPDQAAPGLTITVGVQCPQQGGGSGYGDGKSHPVCD